MKFFRKREDREPDNLPDFDVRPSDRKLAEAAAELEKVLERAQQILTRRQS